MNLKTNEVWVCLEPCCRAEIVVRKGANPECPGNFMLRCCCGKEMVREEMLELATPRTAAKETGAK